MGGGRKTQEVQDEAMEIGQIPERGPSNPTPGHRNPRVTADGARRLRIATLALWVTTNKVPSLPNGEQIRNTISKLVAPCNFVFYSHCFFLKIIIGNI